MKTKIIQILKQFEQNDYKRGGVSIAPEMYEAIANKILETLVGTCDECKVANIVIDTICPQCKC